MIISPVLKKGDKEDVGSYMLGSLPPSVMGKILIAGISNHVKDRKLIRSSHQEYTRGNEMTSLVDKERAMEVVNLDFSEVFDTSTFTLAKEASSILGCKRKSTGSRLNKVIPPSSQHYY